MIREVLLSQVTEFEEWKYLAGHEWKAHDDPIKQEFLDLDPQTMVFARMKQEWT